MRKLIVNPDTPSAWEIPLNPGILSVGRGQENDVVIEHSSISGAHCSVNCGDTVSIRDTGSTNGTFIDGELVEEAVLKPGQTFRMGEVVFRYENDVPEMTSLPREIKPPMPPPVAAVSDHCKFHPRSPSRYVCPKCGICVCELCVSIRREHGKMARFCRTCSVEFQSLEPRAPVEVEEQSFARLAMGAFSYPLKGDGIFVLVLGGIFLLLIDGASYFAKFSFFYGLVALLILSVFGTGYLVSFLQRILTSSAAGENHVPDWPEITEFGSDLLAPFLQFLGTVAFCFAPTVVLIFIRISLPEENSSLGWLIFVSILASCVYFPMAFTAVAMFDSVMAVNPLLIVPSIMKILRTYVFTIVLFVAVLTVRWLGHRYLPTILHPAILSWIISGFFGLYLLIVEVRILGLLYREKKAELGWFNR